MQTCRQNPAYATAEKDNSQQRSVFEQPKSKDLRNSTDFSIPKTRHVELFNQVPHTEESRRDLLAERLPLLDEVFSGQSTFQNNHFMEDQVPLKYQSFGPRKITITKAQRRKLAHTVDFNSVASTPMQPPKPPTQNAHNSIRSSEASHKKKKPEPRQIDNMLLELNPLIKELKELERNSIENKKMVVQGKNHIQYAAMALQAAEINKSHLSKKQEAVQTRLATGFLANSEGFGVRHGFKALKDYFKESREHKVKLEKYFIQHNIFDHRLQDLDTSFKFFNGLPATVFINEAKYYLWMEKHRMADQIKVQ